jgi:heme-degrading monooxygenase HmoA
MAVPTGGLVIARIWTGATRDKDADAYEEYMREEAVPGYTNVPGHRALLMLRRPRGDGSTEFTMITCWDDMDSVAAFAGPDPEQAVFYPRDAQFLVDRDLTVRHYEVYGAAGLAG